MANNPVKYSAYDATKTALFAASDLKNIATGAAVLSATAISNASGSQKADLEVLFNAGSAVSAGGYVALWFVKALDGTNYEDANPTGPVVPARPADVVVPLRAVSGAQVITVPVVWPMGTFKPFWQNNSGQTTTNTDSLTQVNFRAYNDNLVTA